MTTRVIELLPDLLATHAAHRSAVPAIVEAGVIWSWSELDRWADTIGERLQAAAGPSGRIGLALPPTALGVAAIHGAARAGVTAILVNPRSTGAEIGTLLRAAGTKVLAVDPTAGVDAPAEATRVELARLEPADRSEASDPPIGEGGVAPAGGGVQASGVRQAGGGERAGGGEFVVPTSGSTARPKLARLPLDRLTASAAAWIEALPPATGWLLSVGLTHVAGLGIVVRAAAAGVPVVIVPSGDDRALETAIEDARRQGTIVSHLSLVAAQLAGLLEATDDRRHRPGFAPWSWAAARSRRRSCAGLSVPVGRWSPRTA